MKNITFEEIEVIKRLLLQRNSYKQIRDMLDKLPECEEEKTKKELKDIKDRIRTEIRECGRSYIIEIEKIEQAIKDF